MTPTSLKRVTKKKCDGVGFYLGDDEQTPNGDIVEEALFWKTLEDVLPNLASFIGSYGKGSAGSLLVVSQHRVLVLETISSRELIEKAITDSKMERDKPSIDNNFDYDFFSNKSEYVSDSPLIDPFNKLILDHFVGHNEALNFSYRLLWSVLEKRYDDDRRHHPDSMPFIAFIIYHPRGIAMRNEVVSALHDYGERKTPLDMSIKEYLVDHKKEALKIFSQNSNK